MITFKSYLDESYKNLLPGDEAEKEKHKEDVFKMLQDSYRSQGGLAGRGFKSPDDMVKNIPFWKLHHNNKGELTHAVLYKDKLGRKAVALGTNGTAEGKARLTNTMGKELGRSHIEISGSALNFYKKNIGPILPIAHTREQVKKMYPDEDIQAPKHDDPELLAHPELKDHLYVRNIGGESHTKVSAGNIGNAITPKTPWQK